MERLGTDQAAAAVLVLSAFLLLEELLAVAFVSVRCRALAHLGFRRLRLQAVGCISAPTALLQLVASPLTDFGAALQELDLTFCQGMDNELLKSLPKSLPSLTHLVLDGCQEIDDEGLQAVAQRCRQLRHLSLYWNVKGTDVGFCKILRAQRGKDLHTVNFSGCKNLSDETVQRLAPRSANIEVLDLTRCPLVTDSGVQLVCECFDKLRVLRLYAMAQLNPKAYGSLKRLVHLEELDLCGCRVQDEALTELLSAAAPSKLHTLSITWCLNLTDAVVVAVARACPVLSWLSLFGNMNFTAAALETLAASPCGSRIRSLDVRGLTKALPYSSDHKELRKLFPAVVDLELHH